ncbi:phosphoribosylaminoimidazole carboxylase, catalytic subunit [Methanocaldococcus infernus ME]|uniref:N5-carboxyaminoimidazole ribonucleotide mutase n=1 Tax=Methanocaldococcus infernus (strain DSM 11812 / JCM 15783 / ME) TaxID=573063 RepID=D5VTZ6_METIM|nr:5-(carboxyamino)imidazole ribonucleotide mutase [Methanocaldococcus infernus]ADG14049.1 phosphoribosylaminoimidazole carboxylase, catalytic subunit [Methanocaldococcus infernus ME]
MAKVGIIMGSDSDLPILKDAAKTLEELGIDYIMTIASAHRTPERVVKCIKEFEEKEVEVIIAGAGGAAHLPGVVASLTILPVIGVPIKSTLQGLDSLLSIVQMPSGIPVATVAINNAKNAALLAAEILGIKYDDVREKLIEYRKKMKESVEKKGELLEKLGYEEYLEKYKK